MMNFFSLRTFRATLLCGLIAGLCLAGCAEDKDYQGTEVAASDEITLAIPTQESMIVRSTDPAYDCQLAHAYVLIYPAGEELPTYTETVTPAYITNNGTGTPTLRIHTKIDEGARVVVITNADFAASGAVTSLDDVPLSQIEEYFPLTNAQLVGINDGSQMYLPMYGELSHWIAGQTLSLTRSMAKVRVGLAATVTYSDLAMQQYFEAQPAPEWSVWSHARTSVVQHGVTYADAGGAPQTFAANAQSEAYLYAYPNATKANGVSVSEHVYHKDRDCVILKYGEGYYRLDFSTQDAATSLTQDAANTYMDLAANYIYTFRIARIFSYGYTTAAEAYQNPAGNVEYTVEVLDESKTYVSSNGQYAIAIREDTAVLFNDDPVLIHFDLCTYATTGRPDITTAYVDIVDAAGNAESIEGHFYVEGGNTMAAGELYLGNQTGDQSFKICVTDILHDEHDYYDSLAGKYIRIRMGNITRKVPIRCIPVTFYYGEANTIELPTTAGEAQYQFDATPFTTTSPIYSYQNTPDNELCQPYSAAMLWSDVSADYVKDVSVTHNADGTHTVNFTSAGTPGNAVIAIYNKPNPDDPEAVIIWSFHIWASDRNDTTQWYRTYNWTDGGVFYDHDYEMMDRNLGATSTRWPTRPSVSPPGDYSSIGFYYQWGRKDPFVGNVDYRASYGLNTLPVYMRDGSVKTVRAVTNATTDPQIETVNYIIKNPEVYRAYGITVATDQALWGNPSVPADKIIFLSKKDIRTGVKSVYDPCPEGYQVPPKDAFTCSLKSDPASSGAGSGSNCNYRKGPDKEGGYYVYYDATKQGVDSLDAKLNVTMWPSAGSMGQGSKAWSAATHTFFWTNAMYYKGTQAQNMPSRASFGSYFNPIWYPSSAKHGNSVRCVKIHW